MSRVDRVAARPNAISDDNTFAGVEWLVQRRGEDLARGQVGYADPAGKNRFQRTRSTAFIR